MNLEHKSLPAVIRRARLFFQRRCAWCFVEIIFGQSAGRRLVSPDPFMSLSLFVRRAAICFCWGLFLGLPVAIFAQANYYTTNGTEYPIIGSMPGDQVFPDVALNSGGGFVVWQDNITDGSGWGVSAARLDSTLSLTTWKQQVNVQGTNNQVNARVALLNNGGAVFVWQGGPKAFQQIYARFLTPANTWVTTNDVLLNSPPTTNVSYSYSYATNFPTTIKTNKAAGKTPVTTNTTTKVTTTVTTNLTLAGSFRANPAVATLANGNVIARSEEHTSE